MVPSPAPSLKRLPVVPLLETWNHAYVFLFPRVFWFGPLLGGVLATFVWEGILRPAQPTVQPTVQPGLKNMLEARTVCLSGSMSSVTRGA